MELPKRYKLSPGLLAKAEQLGIYGETAEARILQMAALAQEYKHSEATHRFRQYIMAIKEDGTVTTLDQIDAGA